MIERDVLKDPSYYEPKLMGNFTKRQVICMIIGFAVAAPIGFYLNKYFIPQFSFTVAMFIWVIIFAGGSYKFKIFNSYIEKFAPMIIRTRFLSPSQRKYQTVHPHTKKNTVSKKDSKKEQKKYNEQLKTYEAFK